MGNASDIKAKRVLKQKNDREDARFQRVLLVENGYFEEVGSDVWQITG